MINHIYNGEEIDLAGDYTLVAYAVDSLGNESNKEKISLKLFYCCVNQ